MSDFITAFYFEDNLKNISSGIAQADLFRFRHNSRAFGASGFIMIDVTEFQIGQYYKNGDSEIDFERVKSIQEIDEKYPDYTVVALETQNTLKQHNQKFEMLDKFVHPEKAIYVVGGDSGSCDMITGREDKTFLNIPSLNVHAIWSESALAIAIYDRFIKTKWQSQ